MSAKPPRGPAALPDVSASLPRRHRKESVPQPPDPKPPSRENPAYAELAVTSNYSFLRGASHPSELVTAAAALGLAAIGVADRNSLAGVVRAHVAAKQAGLRFLVGARLVPEDGPEMLCYPRDRAAYGRLCRLLTLGKRRAGKAECRLGLADIEAHGEDQELILLPPAPIETGIEPVDAMARLEPPLRRLTARFPDAVSLAAVAYYGGDDARRLARRQRPKAACRSVRPTHLRGTIFMPPAG